MSAPLKQSAFLAKFSCLGEKCEDTCCKGWGMQLDDATFEKYKKDAPELMQAVDTGEADHIMRRDPETDYCVKFDNGLCGIHKTYGTDFLGDACHFYPRITRRLGNENYMTAALSCPEVARLVLWGDAPFAAEETNIARLPNTMREYVPEGMKAEDAWSVHKLFLDITGDETISPERCITYLGSLARSLDMQPASLWAQAAPFYIKNVHTRLPAVEPNSADPFNLLHALVGLIGASKKSRRERLIQTIKDMESALHVTLGWQPATMQTSEQSAEAWIEMQFYWSTYETALRPLLHRWIQAQISIAFFPFSGFGKSLTERITIIGVRFATLKLALMSASVARNNTLPDDTTIVRIVQSLSRFLDHLADPTLSMQIYNETGWVREPRMRALIGDSAY